MPWIGKSGLDKELGGFLLALVVMVIAIVTATLLALLGFAYLMRELVR